jgi:diguanylate cyclase (GGDEF)-like protein
MMGMQSEQVAAQSGHETPALTRARTKMANELANVPPRTLLVYGVLATCVVVYVLSVLARGGQASDLAIDGWGVAALELVVSAACLARLFVAKSTLGGRGFVLALGCGMVSWSIGDVITATRFGAGTPVAADLCYLGFYPLAYAAIVLLMRQEVSRFPAPTWLDGALAGLGAAAVCAAFAFRDVLHSTHGSTFATAMNLAYPIGDVLLLALVIGGTAMLRGPKRLRWLLVATACTINAVGDTFNLLHGSAGASAVGQAFNATAWPVAILLMSFAAWARPHAAVSRDQNLPTGFVLPGLAAAAGLVILTVGSVHPVGRVALGLASATLAVAGLRLALSVGTLRSVTEQRHRQSMTDELTGLGNRRYLSLLFESLAVGTTEGTAVAALGGPGGPARDTFPYGDGAPEAAPAPTPAPAAPGVVPVATGVVEQGVHAAGRVVSFSVLFVDLDRFKEVNDSFGHAVGDELLRQIGPRLTGALRKGDSLVRLGGDEFAVVLPGTEEEQAVAVAERIALCLEQPFFLDLVPVQISGSIGIAVSPRDGSELSEVLRCADSAMYRAKLSRVQVQVYDRAFDEAGDLLQLAEELRDAVNNGQLVLHFQPQLDLKTGAISTLEALLRWEHPRLGSIPPLRFLPLAEEAGLMPAVTARVLNDALDQCARWHADGQELTVSVNVSATNLLDSDFVDMVRSAVERSGVRPDSLILEITETCIISDYERSRNVIDQLQHLGIVTSIDDFGAGFTSLAHLSNLAVGELKLDRAFIAPLAERDGTRDVELVRSTIGLGHALGLRVVAEGVETSGTLSLLSEFGCDVAQGFLISRPVPAERLELAKLAAAWKVPSLGGTGVGGRAGGAMVAVAAPVTNGSAPA